MNNVIGLSFGALAPPLENQLMDFDLPKSEVGMWQKCADSINLLRIRGYMTDGEVEKCRKRLMKNISSRIREAAKGRQQQGETHDE